MHSIEKRTLIPTFLMIVGLLIFIGGCSSDSDDGGTSTGPSGGSSSATIDPATGGAVTYEDVSIVFPPGAVNESLDVTLGIPSTEPSYTAPADIEQVGDIYEAGPSGTQFNIPVTVTFSYSDDDLGGYDETTLAIWSFDQEGDDPEMLDVPIVDTNANTVAATTNHFSYFFLGISSTIPEEPPATPVLSSPANGATNQPTSVTLKWNAASGAAEYHLQVATDEAFNDLFFDQTGITGTSIGVGSLETNTTYYWRVMASNEYGDSDWSETWSFTTGEGGGGGGGDIVGTWVYDYTEYNFPNPDSIYTIEMSGWADEQDPLIVQFTNDNQYIGEGVEWYRTIITFNGIVIVDETINMEVDEGGTYTTDGNLLTVTITYDNIDPSSVGESMTAYYSVEGDDLTLSTSEEQQGYLGEAVSYFHRQ